MSHHQHVPGMNMNMTTTASISNDGSMGSMTTANMMEMSTSSSMNMDHSGMSESQMTVNVLFFCIGNFVTFIQL